MKLNVDKQVFDAAYQPQIRTSMDTRRIMLNVIIALLPGLGFGIWQFGINAFVLASVSLLSAVFFEWAYRRLTLSPTQ